MGKTKVHTKKSKMSSVKSDSHKESKLYTKRYNENQCEEIPDTKHIKVSHCEFRWNYDVGNESYYLCKYVRTNPKICKGSVKRNLKEKREVVQIIHEHDEECPYLMSISDDKSDEVTRQQ